MTDAFYVVRLLMARARLMLVAVVGTLCLGLAGCETSNNVLASLGPSASAPPATTTSKPTKKNVAFAPLIGAPANVSKQLSASVADAVQKQNVPVITAVGAPSDYTVRGYVVAAPDQAGTKLSYIWDVTDPSGKRAHRITGEEFVKGKTSADPWANIDAAVINGIANKTATQLAAWVPPVTTSNATTTAGTTGTRVASAAAVKPSSAAAKPTAAKARTAAVKTASAATGSLPALAMIPPVTGAPGDGQRALAEALKRNLSSRGIPLTTKASLQTYTVKGNVALGKAVAGKQDIKIEWLVLDPAGQRVGTVAQKNKIPEGSLNGKWGKTADAAATAAAQGVAKLLPKTVQVN